MYISRCETKIENNLSITLDDIESDLSHGCWDALYYAKESQISKLIEQKRINEDFSSRYQDYQEELRCLVNEF